MKKHSKMTYVSLFSSAGVGCHGFKMEDFDCIATNELISRRLNIQKYNKKCKFNSGYILGDITTQEVKNKLLGEISYWKKNQSIKDVDVLTATPPCQGMSVANHKKSDEIKRNSLVIESIKIIKEVKPRIFIFENVALFMKTVCTDIDGVDKPIGDAIDFNLSDSYSIMYEIINFKNYGSCSSRTRTIVIGVRNDLNEYISPIDLFPKKRNEKTLYQTIGKLKSLKKLGEISNNDIYHFFRKYPEHMRDWIHSLKEGQSAFDNKDEQKIPHTIINGKVKFNVNKNGNKYTRQYWNKIGPCIHTRNDQLASQNTIHPSDDRVFSIRELMKMMTIPNNFKWVEKDFNDLNSMTSEEKNTFLKKEEINIRQSIGEAVPTAIFRSIAKNIADSLSKNILRISEVNQLIEKNKLIENGNLIDYIKKNENNYSFTTLIKIAELSNAKRNENEAFYTNKSLLNYIYKELPKINKKHIRVLEPSVGVGNFIPYIVAKYASAETLIIDVIDIDGYSLKILKELMKKISIPENVIINYIEKDFLKFEILEKYDLIIGNPPFSKLKETDANLKVYRKNAYNKESNNTVSYFIEKSLNYANNVVMITPKYLLNTNEYKLTRKFINKFKIESLIDFGEKGFEGVLIETICFNISTFQKPANVKVISLPQKRNIIQKQKYITDDTLPYWIIYRDKFFDSILTKMEMDIFDVFRDRQITNGITKNVRNKIWVIRSRNLSDDGKQITNIENYDAYIDIEKARHLNVYRYLNASNIYLTPNMTYKPRVCLKPNNVLVNGSMAILIPKYNFKLSNKQLEYFASQEYRDFYKIARNFATRSLNIDGSSVYFFGKLKEC